MSLFGFVDAEKARLPVSLLCDTVGVSKSGYHARRGRPPPKRSREDAALAEKIREVHERSRRTYGYPRVRAELRALGVRCGRRRAARLMRKAGLRGRMRARKKRTTRRDPRAAPAQDLVSRNFAATAPDRLWTADITYLRTDEGFLHPADVVLDAYSRRIVGWSMASHPRTELVVDAPEMAVWRRKPAAGLVHHSDRGAQYTALSFGKRLEEVGITPSMGRAGSALDNAVSESFIATLKVELVHACRFPTREAARSAVFEYLEAFYNRRRLHSSLGYFSPEGFEDLVAKEVAAGTAECEAPARSPQRLPSTCSCAWRRRRRALRAWRSCARSSRKCRTMRSSPGAFGTGWPGSRGQTWRSK